MFRTDTFSKNFLLVLLLAIFSLGCNDSSEQSADSLVPPELKKIVVGDAELSYLDWGQGEPVVLVHGALGDFRTWDGQLEAFSEKFRVISYSRRYHYPNDYPRDTDIFPRADHVGDLKGFLDELDIRSAHLVGHSSGGAISLEFARDYPEYLLSLSLGEPGAGNLLAAMPEGASVRRSFAENVNAPTIAAFQAGDDEAAIRIFIDGVMGGENGFAKLSSKFRAGMLQNAHTLKSSRLTDAPRPRPRLTCEEAGQIRIPTLLIHGEVSPKRFILTNDALAQCLPIVERAMLPSVSHSLEMENPAGFNELVLNFLERHGQAGKRENGGNHD